jgi:DNA helicase-2/ATP-dependent DNA helicase PcrA
MQNLIEGLNPEQKEAVMATEGPVLIVAGAGAGKTKTITHRIGNLIDSGVTPEAILAITFTNKAAREMRERVLRLLGRPEGSGGVGGFRPRGLPWVGTFHGLGVHILREKGEAIGVPKRFTILDKDDALSLLRRAMKDCGIDTKEFPPSKIHSLISRHKSNMEGSGNIENLTQNRLLGIMIRRAYERYEKLLVEEGALDFDDLLVKTVRLLETHPDVLKYFRTQWQYIHVDEYQDTNTVQYRLVRLLADGHRNLCVVGDSDQNIYSWRGASIANILKFEEDYPGAKVILLEENYRSTETILAAANAVIEKNTLRKPKRLFTNKKGGDMVGVYESYDENDEGRWIAGKIAKLMEKGVHPAEVAILYRTNFQSRVLEEALLYAGIPHQVLGTRFFERKEVKDVLAYIRAAQNPKSTIDMGRIINVPVRGIGKVTLDKIIAGQKDSLPTATRAKVDAFYKILVRIREAGETKKPSELVAFTIIESGISKSLMGGDEEDQERLGNVRELVTLATKYDFLPEDEATEQFLADVALLSDQDNMNTSNDAARLMTVHAAKGLEFPYVFITGLEQDLFPSRRAGEENRDLSEREEERRLFYVAITRAAKQVFLSHASFRTIFGQRQVNLPSEFLEDIPSHLMEYEEKPKSERKDKGLWGHRNLLGDEPDDILYF